MATEPTATDPSPPPRVPRAEEAPAPVVEAAAGAAARGRRSFLRHGTAAALSVLGAVAGTLLGTRPAAAIVNRDTCCAIVRTHSPWCPYYCLEFGTALSAWACNNGACLCYECYAFEGLGSANCWVAFPPWVACSAHRGCCER